MNPVVFYYTGTGNSLRSAQLVAERLGGAKIFPMRGGNARELAAGADAVGLVFPVHMWGLPGRVVRFVESLALPAGTYVFALAVNAGQVSRTLVQLQNLLAKRELKLAAGYSLVMPSNYIPWGGPGPKEHQRKLFLATEAKIDCASRGIAARLAGPVERGPLWQRIVFTPLYHLSFRQVAKMDRGFWVDEKCTSCGICVKICPAGNVALESGKPAWQHRCEQCLACLQWCPAQAIQYGKKTPQYERYHHPDIELSDLLP